MTIPEAMAILALQGAPTLEEIQSARRLQLKVWHPDRFVDDPVVHAEAERRTKLINEAWRTLERVYEVRGGMHGLSRAEIAADERDESSEPVRRVSGGTRAAPLTGPQPQKRWSEGVVTAILCAGWLVPILAGAFGAIDETTALGAFMVFVLVAYAYLVLMRFVK